MKCKKCGFEYDEEIGFCPNCGSPIDYEEGSEKDNALDSPIEYPDDMDSETVPVQNAPVVANTAEKQDHGIRVNHENIWFNVPTGFAYKPNEDSSTVANYYKYDDYGNLIGMIQVDHAFSSGLVSDPANAEDFRTGFLESGNFTEKTNCSYSTLGKENIKCVEFGATAHVENLSPRMRLIAFDYNGLRYTLTFTAFDDSLNDQLHMFKDTVKFKGYKDTGYTSNTAIFKDDTSTSNNTYTDYTNYSNNNNYGSGQGEGCGCLIAIVVALLIFFSMMGGCENSGSGNLGDYDYDSNGEIDNDEFQDATEDWMDEHGY